MKRLKKLFRRRNSDIQSSRFGRVELGNDPVPYSPSSSVFQDHLGRKEFTGPVRVETGEFCVPMGSDFPTGALHLDAAISKLDPKSNSKTKVVSTEPTPETGVNPVAQFMTSEIEAPNLTSNTEEHYVLMEPPSQIQNDDEEHFYESIYNIQELQTDSEPEITEEMVKAMKKRLKKASKLLAKTDKKLKRHEKRLLSLYEDLARAVRHLSQLRSRPNITEQAKVLQKIKELMEGIDVSEFEAEVRRYEPALYKQYIETKTSKDAAELIQKVNEHRQNLLKLETLVRRKRLEWNCRKYDIEFSPVPSRTAFKKPKSETNVELEVRGQALDITRLDAAIGRSVEDSGSENDEEAIQNLQVQATILSPVETSV